MCGVVRVDVMYSNKLNRLIALELESLEAVIPAMDIDVDAAAQNYLSVHHANNIILCLRNFLNAPSIELLTYPELIKSKIILCDFIDSIIIIFYLQPKNYFNNQN